MISFTFFSDFLVFLSSLFVFFLHSATPSLPPAAFPLLVIYNCKKRKQKKAPNSTEWKRKGKRKQELQCGMGGAEK